MLQQLRVMPNGVRLFLVYGGAILALLGLTLPLVVDQAIEAPVSPLGIVYMLLLAYCIFTITLVLQRKQAAYPLALGLATLSVPLIPIAFLSPAGLAGALIALALATTLIWTLRQTFYQGLVHRTVTLAHPQGDHVSKRSRTFQPPTSTSGKPAGSTGESSTPAQDELGAPLPAATVATTSATSPTSATSRSAARRRAANSTRVSAPPSFFERYRAVIVGVIAVVLVGGIIAVVAGQNATTANAYQCETLLTPGPTDPIPTSRPATPVPSVGAGESAAPDSSPAAAATPQPQPTQRLGFTTEDLGRNHVAETTKVTYGYCPPASGKHYNLGQPRAPLARQFYPPSTKLGPGNWVHNLEHGYVVLLYRGEQTPEILQQLQDIMAEATPSAQTAANCGYSKVIAVRFDDMDPNVNFAALAWDRALLLKDFDKQQLLTFANQSQDGPQLDPAEMSLC